MLEPLRSTGGSAHLCRVSESGDTMHVESLHRYARPQIGMFSDWLAGSFFGVDGTNKFPVDTGFS